MEIMDHAASVAANTKGLMLRVVRKVALAQDIAGFELQAPDASTLPHFSPGAHLEVEVRAGLKRQYSLWAPPDGKTYRIGVLRAPDSRGGSAAMHDQVQVGDTLWCSTPKNHFELEENAAPILLLAAGIGITPILCMADTLHQRNVPFELHYAARSRERMAFAQHLQDAGYAQHTRLYVEGEAQARADLAQVVAAQPPGTHLYVCGPKGFIDVARQAADQAGWDAQRVHFELFGASVDPVALNAGDAFCVELRRSGRVIPIQAGVSIAESLLAAGVEVETSCEQGICGTCITRVLQGEPDHRDAYLTADEKAANDQMLICCSRAKSQRLVLDL
ncbi:PDR/VanB family oxidoreductase [Variovorax sp. HJSM1_2]|uniref:PDR/VanB family oxidoreductase n=1 Tax=Variovorax sp. HJSM1_2 TaxID=3366263 RepID=UPI003BD73E85